MRRLALAALIWCLVGFVPSAPAQVLLKHKLNQGSTRTYEVTQLINQVLTINGQEVKTDADTSMTLSVAVGQSDSQGKIPQRVKFESLRNSLMLPGGLTLNFDSSINLAKTDSPQLEFVLDSLKALSGATYTLIMDKDNQVVAVEGAEEILKNATPAAAEVLKQQLSQERLKAGHEQELARLPKKAVKPGDTWEQTDEVDLGSGQTIKMLRLYEYQGTEERGGRTLDKISSPDTKVQSFDIAPSAAVPVKVVKQELTVAESKALMYFDREKGIEVQSTRLMHLKGKMTLSVGGMELPTDVDLKIETSQKLKE